MQLMKIKIQFVIKLLNLPFRLINKYLIFKKKVSNMRERIFWLGFIVFLFISTLVNSQNGSNAKLKKDSLLNNITNIDKRLKKISIKDASSGFLMPKIDTLSIYQLYNISVQPERDSQGLLVVKNNWKPFDNDMSFRDTIIIDPAFLPVVFEGKILPSKMDFLSKIIPSEQFHLISPDSTFAPQLEKVRQIEVARRAYYMNNPLKIKLNALNFKNSPVPKENVEEKRNIFKDLLTTDNAIGVNTPDIEKFQIKPVYWLTNGEHRLQLSFNTYSDQWGGENNFDLFSNQKFTFNYKKKKIEFNNLVEWRLQLKQITSVDKDKEENKNKNKINVIEDYIRTYSTFGLKAIKKWSYSSNLEMKTPLFSKLTNEVKRVKQRAFLSPFELNLGVGMRYATEKTWKDNKYKKFNFSTDLSVLSVNYKYVGSDSIPVTWFGIEEGNKSKTELGSTVNMNVSYAHNRYTKFTSRIKYFTNYEKVYLECENSFDFALNRYFSTTLYFYLKYDDGVPVEKKNNDKTWGYFNYNQMVRFGLTYTW